LIDTRQRRATSLYITVPKFEVQGQQPPNIFGQKYPEHFNSSTTKVLEPSTKKRRRQKAFRRPSEIHGSHRRKICSCLFDGSTLRQWLLTTLAITLCSHRAREVREQLPCSTHNEMRCTRRLLELPNPRRDREASQQCPHDPSAIRSAMGCPRPWL
jgi:hypothetical protein